MNDDDQKTPDNKGKRHRQLTKEAKGAKIKTKLKTQRVVSQRWRETGSSTKKVQSHGRGGITSGADLRTNADDDLPSRGKVKARMHGENHKDLMRQTGQQVKDAIGKIPQDSAHIGALLNFVKDWSDTVTGGFHHQAVVRAFIDIFEVATKYDEVRGDKSRPIEALISATVKKLRELNANLPVKIGKR